MFSQRPSNWLALLGSAVVLAGLSACSDQSDTPTVATNANTCGHIDIAEMDWASAELMANVDKVILEKGYGCDVTLVSGATNPTFASMNEKAQPDVAPEMWTNAVREPLEKAMAEDRISVVNSGPITDLGEGWWIHPHTAKAHPEFKTVLDVLERPDLFPDKEDPSKGAFIGCPSGWGCQAVNINLFKAFDMEAKGWKLVDPGSAAGLDGSMAKAAERNENWFGYYWSPTAMIGKYNMVKLDFGVPYAGDDNWNQCIVPGDHACTNIQPSAWTESTVRTIMTKQAKAKAGEAAVAYFEKRIFPGNIMNGMLVYMNENQADGKDAAVEFLVKHPDIWQAWVPADVAEKVKAAVR